MLRRAFVFVVRNHGEKPGQHEWRGDGGDNASADDMQHHDPPRFWRPPDHPTRAKADEREREYGKERRDDEALRANLLVEQRRRPADRKRQRERRPEKRRLAPRQRRDALRYRLAAHGASIRANIAASLRLNPPREAFPQLSIHVSKRSWTPANIPCPQAAIANPFSAS